MQDIFDKYISSISSKFSHEETSEMGYRTDFEVLIKEIFASIKVQRFDHDPKSENGNRPDFVVRKNDVPILYIENKNIGVSLDKVEKSEQMSRYYGYDNLILNDYLEFRFYRNGLPYGDPIKIANYNIKNRVIIPIRENYEYLAKTLVDFTQSHKEPIKSASHLAKIMGGKGQRIRDNIRQFLSSDSEKNKSLILIYDSFKKQLVHDLTKHAFADMYAQTLVYGLFTARFFDTSPSNFSRQEARDLIPKSNPLLRNFFDHITGPDFDERLEIIVDELCEVFSHANIPELMKEYSQKNSFNDKKIGQDPIIHFYEDFLKEYDPDLRRKMGAYYTPLPVVQFIIRSVDYLIKKEFHLRSGLADITKTKDGIHKVQILDPAVGTGTFISKIIRQIYETLGKDQSGRWPAYVQNELLPRLHGFELMMTPYTISHLKLSLAFEQTGFKYFNKKRLGIYLTNSLEQVSPQQELFSGPGFSNSITEESNEASVIKKNKPIMIIIGNPPYAGESSNAFYKENDVYKFEPTGEKLKERNSKWLNDDYVKFIRFAESMIEKTGEGIVAMITAHGYIDNPTFRGMRWHLMNTFDEIYILNLHGNTNKNEKTLDDNEDQNVFNIRTGVSIFFGIKKQNNNSNLAKIYRSDLYGKRLFKFKFLNENVFNSVEWVELYPVAPNYEWNILDNKIGKEYRNGFSIKELFLDSCLGYQTHRDYFSICNSREELVGKLNDFSRESVDYLKNKYSLKEGNDWLISDSIHAVLSEVNIEEYVAETAYRPFDNKWTLLHKSFCDRPREVIIKNILNKNNYSLEVSRQVGAGSWRHIFVSNKPSESCLISNHSKEGNYTFPLYQYRDGIKESNLNNLIIEKITKLIGNISPEDIFDYVYAVLHAPSYREKYEQFLRIDFPRVPYPKDRSNFNRIVSLGKELRLIHLLESFKFNNLITSYSVIGSDKVEVINYKEGNVYINTDQYFGNVSQTAWNFYIGGYQPAQKWLKDRKGKTLSNEEIEHYQKIIISLIETDKIMKKIDKVIKF